MKHYFYRDKKRITIREMMARGWSSAGLRHFTRQADENKFGVSEHTRIEVRDDEATLHTYHCLKADESWGNKIPTVAELNKRLLERSLEHETIFEERPYGYHGQ